MAPPKFSAQKYANYLLIGTDGKEYISTPDKKGNYHWQLYQLILKPKGSNQNTKRHKSKPKRSKPKHEQKQIILPYRLPSTMPIEQKPITTQVLNQKTPTSLVSDKASDAGFVANIYYDLKQDLLYKIQILKNTKGLVIRANDAEVLHQALDTIEKLLLYYEFTKNSLPLPNKLPVLDDTGIVLRRYGM